MMPVDERMIETNPQPFSAHGVNDLLHEVAVKDGAGIEVADVRVMKGEPVVVLGRKDNVPAAGLFGQSCPFAGESGLRPKERDGSLRVGRRVRVDAVLN